MMAAEKLVSNNSNLSSKARIDGKKPPSIFVSLL